MSKRVPPPTKMPHAISGVLSKGYRLGIDYRNKNFSEGKGVHRLDIPVISVGNLSTGGTGKSPMVHFVVRLLQEFGCEPLIAMRGYGARPGQKGDEHLEHEEALPSVPIVAQPDRLSGIKAMLNSRQGSDIGCIVLDDGFQHRKIARDLDIVLIDATRPPDRDELLPAGHLREPVESLQRAQIVILTRTDLVDQAELDQLKQFVAEHALKAILCTSVFVWDYIQSYVRDEHGWVQEKLMFEDSNWKSVRAVCGIGNADAFIHMIRDHGYEPVDLIQLRDHQELSSTQVERMTKGSNTHANCPVMMTRKDWVKAERVEGWNIGARVWVPILRAELDTGLDDIEQALKALVTTSS